MSNTLVVFRRELTSYFVTPVAYIFLCVFLILAGVFTWDLGGLYESNQADLSPLFFWLPVLFLILIPALSMRLWSEERRSGTIELLLTLPIGMGGAVVGKFLAAWCFTGIALLLTAILWWTVNYLGEPDNGVILAAYVGAWLMAGAALSVCALISALTKNQVIAFVLSVLALIFFTFTGFPMVVKWFSTWAPGGVVDFILYISFWTHFNAISRGVIELRDLIYFASVIVLFLFANAVAIDVKKGQ